MNNGKLKINLGCGRHKLRDGFVNIDKLENANPDLLADALNLPYGDGTVDEIYCGHLIEHLTYEEGQQGLRYWHSLLKHGGILGVTVPNFDFLAALYVNDLSPEANRGFNDLFIYSYAQESLHKYCYGEALLKEVITGAGFVGLERLQIDHPYFESPAPWQIGFRAVKP
jgi:predicted SAM-dependent methyltransferase